MDAKEALKLLDKLLDAESGESINRGWVNLAAVAREALCEKVAREQPPEPSKVRFCVEGGDTHIVNVGQKYCRDCGLNTQQPPEPKPDFVAAMATASDLVGTPIHTGFTHGERANLLAVMKAVEELAKNHLGEMAVRGCPWSTIESDCRGWAKQRLRALGVE